MKAVILAGGLGTRLSEETQDKPKPMVEIGGKPVLWHLMKSFSNQGVHHFVICLGYRGMAIKRFFLDYYLQNSDLRVEMKEHGTQVLAYHGEPWVVDLVDTQLDSQTGGRLLLVKDHVKDEDFIVSYADALHDVNLGELVALHRAERRVATMTVVNRASRFGIITSEGKRVARFEEKPKSWINAGIFVFNRRIFSYLEDRFTVLEQEPLRRLAEEGQVSLHHHHGFWQCMDVLHEKQQLEKIWQTGEAPWRTSHG